MKQYGWLLAVFGVILGIVALCGATAFGAAMGAGATYLYLDSQHAEEPTPLAMLRWVRLRWFPARRASPEAPKPSISSSPVARRLWKLFPEAPRRKPVYAPGM